MFYIIVDDFFSENNLQLKNIVGICTDGGRSMSGKYNGLQSLIHECGPLAKWTHYILYREIGKYFLGNAFAGVFKLSSSHFCN